MTAPQVFQSTHPLRGATTMCSGTRSATANFNPRTPCGVRRLERTIDDLRQQLFQSTHPLRGATVKDFTLIRIISISIHAPLAGCDLVVDYSAYMNQFISIHAPLAGCDVCERDGDLCAGISIHAPLAGCDKSRPDLRGRGGLFQSTHPLRGATKTRKVT